MNEKQKQFGLQKMTLLDFPGCVACVVFTTGCDFRCPFCHNAMLVNAKVGDSGLYSQDEILDFLRKRSGILDGVCITGGEPLMTESVFDLMKGIRGLGYRLKLDTNGTYPDRLKRVVEERLADYVAVDVKNCREKYLETAGITNPALLDAVQESISFLMTDAVPYEFRTTVVKPFHTAEDFAKIGSWIRGCSRYFLQSYVDSGDVLGDPAGMKAATPDEMHQYLEIVRKDVPAAELRGL